MRSGSGKSKAPTPLFDSIDHLGEHKPFKGQESDERCLADYKKAVIFLNSYRGSLGTFNTYRREVERLLHWSWLFSKKSIKELKRDDMDAFFRFCQKPPKGWIGLKRANRFIEKEGERVPNPAWRPFLVSISKAAFRKGKKTDLEDFEFSSGALKEAFAILSSFFNFLIQEEYAASNPVSLIRQKSKFILKKQGLPRIRRLTELQWGYLIATISDLAAQNPEVYERTLFIFSVL